MKKVLVLGGTSLLGQYIVKSLELDSNFSVCTTVRNPEKIVTNFYKPETEVLQFEFSINEIDIFDELIKRVKPEIIINCIAVLRGSKEDNSKMILINSFFPQYINEACRRNLNKYFLIQISSDAVFNGQTGDYSEINQPVPLNFYGLTKLAGEVQDLNCLNIRTSFYGPNLIFTNKYNGFFDWIVNTNEIMSGLKNYFFSGLSTIRLADEIKSILVRNELRGIVHIAAQKISKLELLIIINNKANKQKVLSCDEPKVNLTLVSNYRPEYTVTHEEMVKELIIFRERQ